MDYNRLRQERIRRIADIAARQNGGSEQDPFLSFIRCGSTPRTRNTVLIPIRLFCTARVRMRRYRESITIYNHIEESQEPCNESV